LHVNRLKKGVIESKDNDCGGLTLDGFQVPTKPLYHSLLSWTKGKKRAKKCHG